jgi:DNA polymerase-3 subunit gamma/tau
VLLDEIVDAFAAGDAHGVFACIDKVIEVGQDPRRFAEDLLRRLRDLIIVAAVPDALTTGLVDVAADQAERLRGQATTLGPGELTRAAEVLAVGLTEMRGTTAPRLHLELMCARVLLPAADTDERGVHARLDRLERRLQMTGPEAQADAEPTARPAPAAAVEPPQRRPAAEPEPTTTQPQTARPDAPARPAESRPTAALEPRPAAPPEPRAAQPQPTAEPVAAPAAEPEPSPRASGDPLGTVDFRRMWPDILTEVKNRRRFTWILLSQNAHVIDVVDGVLSLGMSNQGARDSFGRGGSEDVLREAILQVMATTVKIQVVIDAGQPAPEAPPTAAPVAQTKPAPSTQSNGAAEAAAQARQNIRPTSTKVEPPPPDEEPSRDDESVEEESANHDELLAKHLGAELIAEEE